MGLKDELVFFFIHEIGTHYIYNMYCNYCCEKGIPQPGQLNMNVTVGLLAFWFGKCSRSCLMIILAPFSKLLGM